MDHPLKPERARLFHDCSEGPEPYVEYRGNAVLARCRRPRIVPPRCFGEINRNPRYTLIAVGASKPGLFVAVEINANRFKVARSKPEDKVSWRVCGVRNDSYVRANGAPIEVDKPKHRIGTCMRPELYGPAANRSEGAHYRTPD